MKNTTLFIVGVVAALAAGCASTGDDVRIDPILNPTGVLEVAPEDAESLIPPVIAEERASIEARPFAMPDNYDIGGDSRVILGMDPYDCVTTTEESFSLASALNDGIREELGRLTQAGVREARVYDPGVCTHLLSWKATLKKGDGDVYACTVNVTLADVNAKVKMLEKTFTATTTVTAEGPANLIMPIRRLGANVALQIVAELAKMAPNGGKILDFSGMDERLVMEGGSLQGIYEGQQMLVYAVIDGVALPLAYADAKPGTTRTNLTPWKFNDSDPLAKTVIDAIDDDPETFAKYGLRAIAVGEPLSPLQRRRLAQ